MPVYLVAPAYSPTGADGKGWNRLSLNAHMGQPAARCALRPRTYAALVESRNTPHAQWGACFAACINGGACTDCPIFNAPPPAPREMWDGDGDGRVLVRIRERTPNDLLPGGSPARLYLMQDAETGWDSRGIEATWEQVSALVGWRIGRPHRDEHSEGFWLLRDRAAPPAGTKAAR